MTGRDFGGWDEMQKVFGLIGVRYQRRAGHAEELAGFTADGRQMTEFEIANLIEKEQLLAWAEAEMWRRR